MTNATRYYETAQICENGHIITKHFDKYPMERCDACPKCGASTIFVCPHCHVKIRGCYHEKRSVQTINIASAFPCRSDRCLSGNEYAPPAFCHSCGKAFPWIETSLEEASRLIAIAEELSPDEQDKLNGLLPDLLVERPHTVSSAITFSHIIQKASPFLQDSLKAAIGNKIVSIALKFLGW